MLNLIAIFKKRINRTGGLTVTETAIIQDIVDVLMYAIEKKDFANAAAFKAQLWSMGVTVDRYGKWEIV